MTTKDDTNVPAQETANVLSLSFNQDGTFFAVATNSGFLVYNASNTSESVRFHRRNVEV